MKENNPPAVELLEEAAKQYAESAKNLFTLMGAALKSFRTPPDYIGPPEVEPPATEPAKRKPGRPSNAEKAAATKVPYEAMASKLKAVMEKSKDDLRTLLSEIGVKLVKEIPEAKYADVIAKADAILGGEEADPFA